MQDSDNTKNIRRKYAPARSPEARENQMIAMAMDLAEKQLMEGTASSQVISHFLKLGSTREKLEKEKIRQENELTKAKIESQKSTGRLEELYQNALDAMRVYSGDDDE